MMRGEEMRGREEKEERECVGGVDKRNELEELIRGADC